MRLRVNLSIGASMGSTRMLGSLTELIRERLEERRQNLQSRPGPSRVEAPSIALWRYASPMEGRRDRWVPHRVVRQTAESVLVEANPLTSEQQGASRRSSGQLRTYWVNRTGLERAGIARVRARKIAFYTSPNVNLELVMTVESLMRLGLWWPYTETDLKRAFRHRALKAHPDAGGSEARFVRLQADHDRALRALNDNWWR